MVKVVFFWQSNHVQTRGFLCFLLITLLIQLLPAGLFAQSPTPIPLRRELIEYRPQHFYIAKVTDGRVKKDNIGTVYNGMANRPNAADLHGGVEKSLHELLRWTLPRDSSKVPVEMEIRHLLIRETLETFTEFAELELMVAFYDLSNERKQLYLSRLKIDERLNVDVTSSHERRIRTAVVQAIKDLDEEGPWGKQLVGLPKTDSLAVAPADSAAHISVKSITADGLSAGTTEFAAVTTPLSANKDDQGLGLGFMLLGSRQIATNSTGWIGTAYLFFNQDPSDWQVPFAIGFEQLVISDEAAIRNGWAPLEMRYRMPGLAAFRKLDELVHLGLFLNVPFGVERTVNLTTFQGIERNFIGVSGGMGLYFMSNTAASLVAGLRLHMMSTNSLSYPRELGLRVEAGFRF
ncbi:MAG: hypothetical protein C0424_07615 [Sphingobacteriaceae bacterium]|nr:hypothetical protein [Sphingobacteriaceae bacterium]